MSVYGVWITRTESENQYDLGIKGRGQIYLKFMLQLIMRSPLSFFDGGCFTKIFNRTIEN